LGNKILPLFSGHVMILVVYLIVFRRDGLHLDLDLGLGFEIRFFIVDIHIVLYLLYGIKFS